MGSLVVCCCMHSVYRLVVWLPPSSPAVLRIERGARHGSSIDPGTIPPCAGITYRGGLDAIDVLYEAEGGEKDGVKLTLFGSR